MADIMTPALGESVTEATVARWTKKAGDAVRKDEILVELETDKVSLEVAAPSDGTLAEINAELNAQRTDAVWAFKPHGSFGETSKTSKKIREMITELALPTGFEPVF